MGQIVDIFSGNTSNEVIKHDTLSDSYCKFRYIEQVDDAINVPKGKIPVYRQPSSIQVMIYKIKCHHNFNR